MCDRESHQSLSQPDHFMRHTIEVERGFTAVRLGRSLGDAGLKGVMLNAQEALTLAPHDVTEECRSMLSRAATGELQQRI